MNATSNTDTTTASVWLLHQIYAADEILIMNVSCIVYILHALDFPGLFVPYKDELNRNGFKWLI